MLRLLDRHKYRRCVSPRRTSLAMVALAAGWTIAAFAQEANFGISMPVTASAGFLDSGRLQLANPNNSSAAFGLRFMLYPTVKLGKHWFAYGALQVRKMPYFYYDAYFTERGLDTDLIQGYLGYSVQKGRSTLVIKAGQLASAFGAFPLRYDDLDNPLLDQPLNYVQRVPIATNQLLCGTDNLLQQHNGFVSESCGGTPGVGKPITPATLYGLPGIEAEFSARPFDWRLQITSGSPANAQGWSDFRHYAQWTAGGGVTIRQGFRVGGSAFSGPYLDAAVVSALPAGSSVRSFPATGVGLDVQWARSRWSVQGEWQHFRFDQPRFVVSPGITAAYGETKMVVTPRLYVAGRAGWLQTGYVADGNGITASEFAPLMKSYEAATGFWINRHQLFKASYSWLEIAGLTGSRFNVYGFEFVTHFTPPAVAFH